MTDEEHIDMWHRCGKCHKIMEESEEHIYLYERVTENNVTHNKMIGASCSKCDRESFTDKT